MNPKECVEGKRASSDRAGVHGSIQAWRYGCRGNSCVSAYEDWREEKWSPPKPNGTIAGKRRSPASKAFDAGGIPGLADHLMSVAVPTAQGCLEYLTRSLSAYPAVTIGGKTMRAHRVVAEAAHGDLRSSPVHHKCANNRCINPDHLQVVTHDQNVAEMFLRNHYVKLIGEMAGRLEELAPGDPLATQARSLIDQTHVRIALKRAPNTEVIIIFALKQRNGDWARMSNGQRFVYSSRELAKRAARHLAKTHGWTQVVEA